MGAREHEFTDDPLPELIALDADFVVSVIVETEEFHAACAAFSARLVRSDVIIAHSPFLRFEVLNAWQKAISRSAIPANIAGQQHLWSDDDRRYLYEAIDEYLDDFLALFRRREVRLTKRLQRRTRDLMAAYRLKSMDACLVACAQLAGTQHVASLDRDFRKIDELELWNHHASLKRRVVG